MGSAPVGADFFAGVAWAFAAAFLTGAVAFFTGDFLDGFLAGAAGAITTDLIAAFLDADFLRAASFGAAFSGSGVGALTAFAAFL